MWMSGWYKQRIDVTVGLHQDAVLSPLMFFIVIDVEKRTALRVAVCI